MIRLRSGAACLLFTPLLACGEATAPHWTRLGASYAPEAGAALPDWSAHGLRVTKGQAGDGDWRVESAIRADEWRATVWQGVWQVARPLAGFTHADGGAYPPVLELEGEALKLIEALGQDLSTVDELDTGVFAAVEGHVIVRTEERPGDAVLRVPVDRGGRGADDRWRVSLDSYSGDGFPLWPSERARFSLQVPAGRALGFALAARRVLPGEQELTWRVRYAGRVLLEERVTLGEREAPLYRRLVLPDQVEKDASGRTELVFELEGGPALGVVLDPVIGPAETGSPGDRPWAGVRPDVVVLVADTFRADNLGVQGGALELTPNLDALAATSLRFERAWSPSTWTLPAHASMFTGLWPHQHGAVGEESALPRAAVTLAERMEAAGYRTGAITDAGYVARHFGLDQGFAWFDGRVREFDETIDAARAWMAQDDGRPIFLFVQTYAVHGPYAASAEARAHLASREPPVVVEGEYLALMKQRQAIPWKWGPGAEIPGEMQHLLDEFQGLYLGGVRDLDAALPRFLDSLDERGVLDGGWFVFTSDHGESFGEHGVELHGTGVWEEQVRIPLFLRGPGIEPGVAPWSACLVDLPATVAEMTGLSPAPEWGGHSLVSLNHERPTFVFQCSTFGGQSDAALIEGGRKLILAEDQGTLRGGVPRQAFSLDEGGEVRNAAGEAWARELGERLGPAAAELTTPLFDPEQAHLGTAERAGLAALGYTGD